MIISRVGLANSAELRGGKVGFRLAHRCLAAGDRCWTLKQTNKLVLHPRICSCLFLKGDDVRQAIQSK